MLSDIKQDRRAKRDKLEALGIDPYPTKFNRTHTTAAALADFTDLADRGETVSLAGRLRSRRDQGKIVFFDLQDASGRLQLVCKQNTTDQFDELLPLVDGGDFVGVTGVLFKTNRGEPSLEVKQLTVLTKSLQAVPDDYYGLSDPEVLLRQRYLDLIVNPDTRELFIKKSRFWQAVRQFLLADGFLEVETPVLESVPGGADARPFVTHHNALDEDFYLRISLEIALKKLMVGGFEKIFEIGRIFRNEGIDAEHLQDYTQLEFYWAYADYRALMSFVRDLYLNVISSVFNTLTFTHGDVTVDWSADWPEVDYYEAFAAANNGLDLSTATHTELEARAQALGQETAGLSSGRLIDLIFKKTVRPNLINPCFLVNPPALIEPLAKRSRSDQNRVERFQVVAYGTELGKGFSEANNPDDQRARFEEQEAARHGGDDEAQRLDESFLTALEYGMPPTAGFGFSERLFAILAGRPIRETVFFPPMRRSDS